MKRFHLALGVSDVEASAWHTDAVNLAIRKVGHEEGGAHRGHGSGDVVRNGEESPPTRRPEPMGGVPKL
jgi:hypothetical protein